MSIGPRMKYRRARHIYIPLSLPLFLVTGRALSDQAVSFSLVPKNELNAL